jgi:predicted PurR-regulated permease PerM
MLERREILVRCGLVFILGASIALAIWSRQIILMALIGIGFAVIVDPVIAKIRNLIRLPRSLSAIIFYFLGISLFMILFLTIFLLSADQFKSFSNELPQHLEKLEGTLANYIPRFTGFESFFEQTSLSSLAKESIERLYKISSSVFTSFSGIALSLVVAFYMSLNYSFYTRQLPRLFFGFSEDKIEKTSRNLANTLRAWFRAQALDMVFVAMLTTFGLWIVGFKYWLVIGLMTGVVGIIPYVGIIVMSILAGLVALAQEPALFPLVLLVFVITQQIEGNFILPNLMKKEVSLPEFPMIIFLFLMGQWLGILGAIIAAPILALLIELINQNRSSKNYILKIDNTEK